jgi:hypothetical protein
MVLALRFPDLSFDSCPHLAQLPQSLHSHCFGIHVGKLEIWL